MKRILLGTVAAFALAPTAFAADLPSRTAPPMAPVYAAPIFTWTGFYVGVNAGVAFNNSPTFFANGGFPTSADNLDPGINGTGFTGGGQIGYNWQTGAFVLGLETDINFREDGGVNGTRPTPAGYGAVTPSYTLSGFNSSDWFGTVRGRLGYTFDRVLIYATGGLAYGGNSGGSITLNSTVGPNAVFSSTGNGSGVGWTVGGGLEYAITNNLSAKVEYLHVDLGNGPSFVFRNAAGTLFKYTETNSDDVVRVGLNYKFGG